MALHRPLALSLVLWVDAAACGGTAGPGGDPQPGGGSLGACPVLPADNAWNRDISADPVDSNSDAYLASMGLSTGLHADFGANLSYGIPYTVVPGTQPKVPITFQYMAESDPGPYPIPDTVPIESGGDAHALVIDTEACYLYEVFQLARAGSAWHGGSGAIWHLRENWMRPQGWTSADAAGLPIFPGLVRYDELAAGAIKHALRFTVSHTQNGWVAPASHAASSSTNGSLPPMGLRVRLKASIDLSHFSARMQIILGAMQHFGMLVADNGSSWYVSGTSDLRWDDDELHTLGGVHGSDFEVVQAGPITPGN